MTYDIKPVRAPRLSGYPLRLFVKLLENPLISPLLVPKLFRDMGIAAFRKKVLSELPLFLPYFPPEHDPPEMEHQPGFGLDVRGNFALVRHVTSIDYIKAQQIRNRMMGSFHEVFADVDAIATPATACTAPAIPPDALHHGESNLELLTKIMRYATIANLIGIPAVSLPVGYDSQGLPVGFQLMGRHWEENLLLRIARSLERTVTRQAPSLYYS